MSLSPTDTLGKTPHETVSEIALALPPWLIRRKQEWRGGDLQARMRFVIETAELNVREQSGGPFAAAIFERDSGNLVALGANLVTSHNNAILHAEIVAIMLAQTQINHFDLGDKKLPAHELVSSSEPCAMCRGATGWSGVYRLVYGATIADAEEIGFDEGPSSPGWKEAFAERGIEVLAEIERERAQDVLEFYKQSGGLLYNGRSEN